MRLKTLRTALLLCAMVFLPASVSSTTLSQERRFFVEVEKAIEHGNEEKYLLVSTLLMNYPLYPYLEYQWLKKHLSETARVRFFLETYKESRYAGLLRGKWLSFLADAKRWQEFTQNYQNPDKDTALECQYHWARYNTGNHEAALDEAKRLWLAGDSLPAPCNDLFKALLASKTLTPDLIWQRFALALKANNVNLALYLQGLMDKDTHALAETWLSVHNNPALINDPVIWKPEQGQLFAHAVNLMARSNLETALAVWDAKKTFFVLDNETVQQTERKLALTLAHNRDERAFLRLSQLTTIDDDVREWKVLSALYAQNWQETLTALSGLTPLQQHEPRWQYWQARALQESGDALGAYAIFYRLAEDRSFYGFLAADTVQKNYHTADKPLTPGLDALDALADEPDFKVITELQFHNKDAEAHRQWWFAIQKLDKDKLMLAAKLAESWHWEQIAIMTLVKADYWDDLGIRFPVLYQESVLSNAGLRDLDPSIVFGLMRQESMMSKDAMSPVGARGLMQIMPKTGEQIARELNEHWQAENSLLIPEVNIKYGTYYFKQLLNRFNGNVALATAAYNAGPHRVDKWLPAAKQVPADVWVETIPFKETRKYVAAVLTYAMIYQQRIHRDALKIRNLLLDVLPAKN